MAKLCGNRRESPTQLKLALRYAEAAHAHFQRSDDFQGLKESAKVFGALLSSTDTSRALRVLLEGESRLSGDAELRSVVCQVALNSLKGGKAKVSMAEFYRSALDASVNARDLLDKL